MPASREVPAPMPSPPLALDNLVVIDLSHALAGPFASTMLGDFGAEIIVTRSITRIDAATHQIHLDGGDVLQARTIILACGVSWRQLEIEGFGPFRDRQTVDFDAFARDGIFLIGGKTGAGKSSILDAVCFVEWPELAKNLLPHDAVRVRMKVAPSGDRTVELAL